MVWSSWLYSLRLALTSPVTMSVQLHSSTASFLCASRVAEWREAVREEATASLACWPCSSKCEGAGVVGILLLPCLGSL